MLEKTIEIGLLFDFYGKLLTERQQDIMKLYYYQDLSLGEIGEELGISRQGVYDHLHRGEEQLNDYEKKLGLVRKYRCIKDKTDELVKFIAEQQMEDQLKQELNKRMDQIKHLL